MNDIVITAARRTPMGAFQGQLAGLSAPQLGACAIRATLEDAGLDPATLDAVLMGCVLQAGLGQAPARQAARLAGLPDAVACTTINKVCGSGMEAVILACDRLRAGSVERVLAGGMESMSNAPYLLPGVRGGYRYGHRQILDHMIYDGLQNVDDGELMGFFAERCADHYGFTREQQDAYATVSVQRAQQAVQDGAFSNEICGVDGAGPSGEGTLTRDETPSRCRPEKIPTLKPVFRPQGGTVTAASSAALADGAAALLLTRAELARENGWPLLARIAGHAHYACAPADFTTAPGFAIQQLLEATGWRAEDIDLYEINEAFAVVAMAAMQDLQIDHARVNVHGGACALGHPIGASGARLLVTLAHSLRDRQLQRGIAVLCIGGGEAVAVALEWCPS